MRQLLVAHGGRHDVVDMARHHLASAHVGCCKRCRQGIGGLFNRKDRTAQPASQRPGDEDRVDSDEHGFISSDSPGSQVVDALQLREKPLYFQPVGIRLADFFGFEAIVGDVCQVEMIFARLFI
jgi:hypothetical protein